MAIRSGGSDDVAGVIAPPPLIFQGFLVLGLALGRLAPARIAGGQIPTAGRAGAGAVVVAAGGALAVLGLRQFRKAGTEVRPDRPTTALVTGGIYRHTRNPLYMALALVYAGIAIAVDSLWALVLLVPCLGVIRYGVITREEAYLDRKFGEEYRRFRSAVRRWL